MCRLLKNVYAILLLFFSVVFFGVSSPGYSEVVLTDTEAQIMLQKIEKSEEKLNQLEQSYSQQVESYEKQLSEVKKDKEKAQKATIISNGTSAVLVILLVIAFIL